MSTDVATRPNLTAMAQGLAGVISAANEQDSESFVMDVMEGILAADSFDEIFGAQESSMLSGKDYDNRPFTIETVDDIQWRKSTQASSGMPVYAVMRVTDVAGEQITLNCGGQTFIAVLWALVQKGYFTEPRTLMLVSVPSPAGAYLKLVPVKSVAKNGKGSK